MKTGMYHILRDGAQRLYRFSGDHVDVVRPLEREHSEYAQTHSVIVRTKRGDLAKLWRIGSSWQRYADLIHHYEEGANKSSGEPEI